MGLIYAKSSRNLTASEDPFGLDDALTHTFPPGCLMKLHDTFIS